MGAKNKKDIKNDVNTNENGEKELKDNILNDSEVKSKDTQSDNKAHDVIENNDNGDEIITESNCSEIVEQQKKLIDEQSKKIDDLQSQYESCKDSLQRLMAEFDNYKKRTAKEKEAIYSNASADVITGFLPVIDNVERAISNISDSGSVDSIKQGVDMVFKQLMDVFSNLGVEEIPALKEEFNPELHNAIMHIEDETCDDNIIVEVFQKGYKLKDKVLRHSMVKVAN